jgi:hypothetical protein
MVEAAFFDTIGGNTRPADQMIADFLNRLLCEDLERGARMTFKF